MLELQSGNTPKNVEDNKDILLREKKQPAVVQRSHNPTIYRAVCNNLNRQRLSIQDPDENH